VPSFPSQQEEGNKRWRERWREERERRERETRERDEREREAMVSTL